MFGYVRPNKPLLLVREYEEYKAVYCTLCKELGKHYGIITRMSLNYDLCFYALISLNYSTSCPKVKKGRCTVNPAKACNYIDIGDDSYKKAAALTVLMTYYKLIDNVQDEGFWKSFAAKFLLLFFKRPAKRASNDYPKIAEALKQMTEEQNEIEKVENASIDACAEPTAKALSVIFEDINEEQSLILNRLGYFLGKWVYTMDAADDLKNDVKDGSFNPFISYMKNHDIDLNDSEKVESECNEVLNSNVSMLIPPLNLLNEGRHINIIENVINLGLPQVQKEILFLHIHEKERKKF